MTKIRNLIFDFDGTLVDTTPLILKTMKATMQEMSLPERSEGECRATIGLRLEEIPEVLWPEIKGISQRYADTYRHIFDQLKRPLSVECFPDVIESLHKLHQEGYRMAIASSRSHKSLEEYIHIFNLTDCFSMLVGGNDVVHGKPAPDPVVAILDKMEWSADETMTIGDAPVDIMMGKAAGTLTCAVTYGNSSYEQLSAAGPDFIVTSFRRFRKILLD